jgi:hypothetical protein
MGWQEDSENDETCAPLTEDEMREFQVISEQVRTSEPNQITGKHGWWDSLNFICLEIYYPSHYIGQNSL